MAPRRAVDNERAGTCHLKLTGALEMTDTSVANRFDLGDLGELADGSQGRVIDVCPDTGDLLVLQRNVRSVRPYQLRLIARASPLRRYAMKTKAFALRWRDCGLRYAIAWPNN
jgi:hypothetical protein